MGKEDRKAQAHPQGLWALGRSLDFTLRALVSYGWVRRKGDHSSPPHLLPSGMNFNADPSSTCHSLPQKQVRGGHLRTGLTQTDRAGRGLCSQILLLSRRNRKCSRADPALRLPNQAACSRQKGGAPSGWSTVMGAGTKKKMGFCH